ncbi:hypothetical protein ACE6H2_023369 [Prunus campanulata]
MGLIMGGRLKYLGLILGCHSNIWASNLFEDTEIGFCMSLNEKNYINDTLCMSLKKIKILKTLFAEAHKDHVCLFLFKKICRQLLYGMGLLVSFSCMGLSAPLCLSLVW